MIEQRLINEVLKPYKENARYLVEAELCWPEGRGRFQIPSSCYIEETGHFNAVDMLICYNQLAYVLFGEASRKGIIPISFDVFKEGQLSNSLIARINNVTFRKPINPSDFRGEIKVGKIKVERTKEGKEFSFAKTSLDFEGKVSGDIDLIFLSQKP